MRFPMSKCFSISLASALLCLSGCANNSVVVSSKHPDDFIGNNDDAESEYVSKGLIYHLPKTVHKVTINYEPKIKYTVDEQAEIHRLKSAVDKFNPLVSKLDVEQYMAQIECEASTESHDELKKQGLKAKDLEEIIKETKKLCVKSTKLTAKYKSIKQTLDVDQQALKEIALRALSDRCILEATIEVGAAETRKDINHQYVAQFKHNMFSDDDVTFAINKKGFLHESQIGKSTGKAKDIIKGLAKFGGLLSGVAGVGMQEIKEAMDGVPERDGVDKPAFACKSDKKEWYMDLTEEASITLINQELTDKQIKKQLYVCGDNLDNVSNGCVALGWHASKTSTENTGKVDKEKVINAIKLNENKTVPGLLYRPYLDYELLLFDTSKNKIDDKVSFQSPNIASLGVADFPASNWVARTATHTFDNGDLLKSHYVNPSEFAEAISLPFDIISSFVSGITTLVDSKTTIVTQNKEYLGEEVLILQKQIELLQKEKDLEDKIEELEKADDASDNETTPVAADEVTQ